MNKIFVLIAIALCTASAFAQSGGNAEKGKVLFTKNGCYQCHGYQGQGGGAGPRIAPRPAASTILYVRYPSGVMPPYTAKALPDGDLADIRAFLATIPAPPPVKSIALLNQ